MKISTHRDGRRLLLLGTVTAVASAAVLAAAGTGPAHAAAQPKIKVASKAQIKAAGQQETAGAKSALSPKTVGGFLKRSAGLDSGSFGIAATTAVPAEGSYISYQNRGYQIVGGAALWVTSFPSGTRATPVSQDTFENVLRPYPADGTFIQASSTHAAYVIVGGNPVYISTWSVYPAGTAAKARVVNQILIDHTDGLGEPFGHLTPFPISAVWISSTAYELDRNLFVVAKPSGRVFKFAGGAPHYVNSWATYGGSKPTVTVVDGAIDRAGQPGAWENILPLPFDGYPIRAVGTSPVYSTLGGAPVYVSTAAASAAIFEDPDRLGLYPGWRPSLVTQANIDNGAKGGVWNHLNYYPADGAAAIGAPSGMIYVVYDGQPLFVPAEEWSWDLPYNGIDDAAVNRAGTGGVWNHLKPAPVEPKQ